MATAEESRAPILGGTLRHAGGIAALTLGAVYAYGALEKATELHGADQTVRDTLPLVPLEQLLVTGISEFLLFGGVLVITGALALWYAEFRARRPSQDRSEKGDEARERETRTQAERRRSGPWLGWLYWGALAFLAFSGIFLFPPIALFLAVYIYVLNELTPPARELGRYVAFFALSWAALTLITAYFEPEKLPQASLELRGAGRFKESSSRPRGTLFTLGRSRTTLRRFKRLE
jgi:hypothetical protein